jgi:uncharacterized protein YndB with AHSA1/START domain
VDRPAENDALVRARQRGNVGGGNRCARRRPLPRAHAHRGRRRARRERRVYREVVPDEKLVFTWQWRAKPEWESLVTVTLKRDGDATILTLIHEQLPDEGERDGHRNGWTGALEKLAGLFG